MRKLLPLLVLLLAPALLAQNPADYERVLLPVLVATPGQNGSDWTTNAFIRNDSDRPVEVINAGGQVRANGRFQLSPSEGGFPAQLLYVPRTASENISFYLRIYDRSRLASRYGTEVPVIRESEFLTRKATLLDIPLLTTYRRTLRVYALDGTSVQFRLRGLQGTDVAGIWQTFDSTITATAPAGTGGAFPSTMPYFESEVKDALPGLDTYPPGVFGLVEKTVLVEVEPVVPGTKFWAFVTVTNNDTQEVATVTPH